MRRCFAPWYLLSDVDMCCKLSFSNTNYNTFLVIYDYQTAYGNLNRFIVCVLRLSNMRIANGYGSLDISVKYMKLFNKLDVY